MNNSKQQPIDSKKEFIKKISLKKSPSSSFNHQILRKTSSRIELEKAYYQADLLLNEENDSTIDNESMFERKHVSIFKFYFHLFEPIDWFYFILGTLGTVACGFFYPILLYINSNVFSSVGNTSENRGSMTEEEIMKLKVKESYNSNIKQDFIYGSAVFATEFIGYFFFGLMSTRCLYNFKKKYFSTILSQEQAWFDSVNIYEFATKIQTQLEYIEQGMGDVIMDTIIYITFSIVCIIFAFLGSWKLTLILLCITPFTILITLFIKKLSVKGSSLTRETWQAAGGIAEEIFYNIKVVASFANFNYELNRYNKQVEISNKIELLVNRKMSLFLALLALCDSMVIFISIIYGRTIIQKDFNQFRGRDVKSGDIFLTFSSMSFSISSIVCLSKNIQLIFLSLTATSDYFNLYERKPQIDLTNSILKPPLSDIKGKIEFKNVNFSYPSDKNNKLILNGMNLNFESGKKIALIGHSGCGKTTVINLIERLYDISSGEILLDGIDIYKLDIQYLRNLIGYVEQEPILFNRSIKDNIIFGRKKYLEETGEDINELIQKACKDSYVSEFVNNLPNGLDYIVGLRGSKLSGGQKQRIAIARAILIKPKILILDEATSALDNKSEKIVQQALDNISKKNITTIIIAHKLSTIKNADIIYVLKDGNVYEKGTHEELLSKGGYYAELIRQQLIKEELENQNKKEEYLRKMSSIKRINTEEEVHFERRDNEIAKSPDDVKLKSCNIIKELWTNKCDFIFALLSTLIYGIIIPFNGYIKGHGLQALSSKYTTIRYDNGLKYSLIFLLIECFKIIVYFIMNWTLENLGINLSKIYRKKMMKKYISFHMSFFDIDRNSPGSLLSKMSIDTVQLHIFINKIIGIALICFSLLVTSIILGFCYEYRLTLITLAFLPFLLFITFLRRLILQVDSKKSMEANMEGGRIISECVTNTKIIFSYNFTKEALNLYLESIDYITQKQIRDNIINGLALAFIYFSRNLVNAVILIAGKNYILNNTLDSDNMSVFQTFMLNNFKTIITAYLPNVGRIRKALASLRSIYSTLETESLIPPFDENNNNKISANNILGKIEFKNVYFAYPSNPEHVILKNINFTILPGQKIALVGYSGCGKSTIIQLLERFYDVEDDKGQILIDDINIKDYNLFELRKKIGLISQEPSMFKTSNIENIRYGNLSAKDEDCYEAAKEVNALNLLQKEDKFLEEQKLKKSTLSGGEKQKLAFARIYLKNPPILLLDEPTSALDKESELDIQKSLDKLSINKTTIQIAHRLNTIENYDKIIVFDKGRIYEQGTHEELMKLKKRYYTLYQYSNFS